MALPPSFAAAGFHSPEQVRRTGKRRRLMIVTEGDPDTGKTEFLMSAPGPGLIIACDRGFDALCDNPKPPKSRRSDFAIKVIQVPTSSLSLNKEDYLPYYREFYNTLIAALGNADAATVAIDGDNHSWDLQRLAEHGKLSGVFPQTRYSGVYAARRSLYFKAWDSGKIIISTNMLRDEYKPVLDANGVAVMDEKGEAKKERTGGKVAQGFPDRDYLWQISLRHLFRPAKMMVVRGQERTIPAAWGIRILRAKANPEVVNTELWGEEATFRGLVETIYPHIDPAQWGL